MTTIKNFYATKKKCFFDVYWENGWLSQEKYERVEREERALMQEYFTKNPSQAALATERCNYRHQALKEDSFNGSTDNDDDDDDSVYPGEKLREVLALCKKEGKWCLKVVWGDNDVTVDPVEPLEKDFPVLVQEYFENHPEDAERAEFPLVSPASPISLSGQAGVAKMEDVVEEEMEDVVEEDDIPDCQNKHEGSDRYDRLQYKEESDVKFFNGNADLFHAKCGDCGKVFSNKEEGDRFIKPSSKDPVMCCHCRFDGGCMHCLCPKCFKEGERLLGTTSGRTRRFKLPRVSMDHESS